MKMQALSKYRETGGKKWLDNLKLGYGGTKTEMERLLADATELTGIKYDISNLSDVYEAIHAVQTEMGITGTTAKEAATTIQGSIGMLKGAWANLLIGLGRDDADLDKLFDNVVTSAKTAFDNIKPVARRALVGIGKLVGEIAPTIAEELPGLMDDLLPDLISGAEGLLGGLADALPDLLLTLLDNLPQLVSSAVTIAKKIFDGVKKAVPELLGGIWERIDTFISESDFGDEWENIKEAVSTAVEDIKTKWEELKEKAKPLTDKLEEVKDKFVEWFTSEETQDGAETGIIFVIQSIATSIENIITGVEHVIDAFKEVSESDDWEETKGKISTAIEDIKRVLGELKQAIKPVVDKFDEYKQKLEESGIDTNVLVRIIDGAVLAIGDLATQISNVISLVESLTSSSPTGFGALGSAAAGAADAVKNAFAPVKSLLDGLFSGLKIPDLGGLSGLFGGQHAIGADYIPYNGYPAILHRGEAVLTAREADEWRRGQGKGSGVVNNFTFNGVSQSDLDYIVAYVNRGLA